jgi:hypothetical protein
MNAIVALFAAVMPAASGIPYRTNAAVPAGSLAWAILVTLLVLGAVTGGLLLARRYGWLRYWAGGARIETQDGASWKVTARVRLSATARAYVLEKKEESYLVIESSQHLAIHPRTSATGEEHVRGG